MTTKLEIHNVSALEVKEDHFNDFKCYTMSVEAIDSNGNHWTDVRLYLNDSDKSFLELIKEKGVRVRKYE